MCGLSNYIAYSVQIACFCYCIFDSFRMKSSLGWTWGIMQYHLGSIRKISLKIFPLARRALSLKSLHNGLAVSLSFLCNHETHVQSRFISAVKLC